MKGAGARGQWEGRRTWGSHCAWGKVVKDARGVGCGGLQGRSHARGYGEIGFVGLCSL